MVRLSDARRCGPSGWWRGSTPLAWAFVMALAAGAAGQASDARALFPNTDAVAALMTDGTVWTWGGGFYGEVGRTGNLLVPGQVGLPYPILRGTSGDYHVLVADANGDVYGWGGSLYGALGPNAGSPTQASPVLIPGIQSPQGLAGGNDTSFFVLGDGTVLACGLYSYLGLGANPNPAVLGLPSPQVNPYLSGIRQISAAGFHALALDQSGQVFSWGHNQAGELGLGHYFFQSIPQLVFALPPNIVQVSAGLVHSLALDAAGNVYAWGAGAVGQLGTGGLAGSPYPVWVTGVPSGVTEISAGSGHSAVRTLQGEVWVWGDNSRGQLGMPGSIVTLPTKVPGLPHITHIEAGKGDFTFARGWNGEVFCWGENANGQMGAGAAGGTYGVHQMAGFQLLPPLRLAAPATAQVGTLVAFVLSSVPALPGSPYYLDVSLSGQSPGLVVPGTPYSVPLNPPLLFSAFGASLPAVFLGFLGTLDGAGGGTATLYVPAAPQLIGYHVSAACLAMDLPAASLRISNGTQTLIY